MVQIDPSDVPPIGPTERAGTRWHLGWALTFLFGCALFLAWALRNVPALSTPLAVFVLVLLAPAIPFIPSMERAGLMHMDFISVPNALGATFILSVETTVLWLLGLGISAAMGWKVRPPIARSARMALMIWVAPFACFALLTMVDRVVARHAVRHAIQVPFPPPPVVIQELMVHPRDSTSAEIEAVLVPHEHGEVAVLRVSDDGYGTLFSESRPVAEATEPERLRWSVEYAPMIARWRAAATRGDYAAPLRAEITFLVELKVRSAGTDSLSLGVRYASLPLHFEARTDGYSVLPPTRPPGPRK